MQPAFVSTRCRPERCFYVTSQRLGSRKYAELGNGTSSDKSCIVMYTNSIQSQNLFIRVVAAQLRDRQTLPKYLDGLECLQPKSRGRRPSILAPYRDYILAQ